MSATSTPNDSPVSVPTCPLHDSSKAAHVVVPQGNARNGAPGMGAKALLAKKLSNQNSAYISPTDSLVTPCSQKLNAAKKKHFSKPAKAFQLFASQSQQDQSDNEDVPLSKDNAPSGATIQTDDENPF